MPNGDEHWTPGRRAFNTFGGLFIAAIGAVAIWDNVAPPLRGESLTTGGWVELGLVVPCGLLMMCLGLFVGFVGLHDLIKNRWR